MKPVYHGLMTVVKHNNEVFLRYRTDNCVILLDFTVFTAHFQYKSILYRNFVT